MKKKNQIPKYYTPSTKGTIKKIQDQLMKNLLTQWKIEEENQKILSVFGEKLLNLQAGYFLGRKLRKNQAKERFRTFLLTW